MKAKELIHPSRSVEPPIEAPALPLHRIEKRSKRVPFWRNASGFLQAIWRWLKKQRPRKRSFYYNWERRRFAENIQHARVASRYPTFR